MAWHETTSLGVIVMLTQTVEAQRAKCAQYFPLQIEESMEVSDEHDGFSMRITVEELEENAKAGSTVRKLKATVAGESKIFWHLLFGGWPDFGVPSSEEQRHALLELIKISKSMSDPEKPRIVHCSAGVGRSGTFIALDYLLDELATGGLRDLKTDPVFDVVSRLREQRAHMVQAEPQFVLIYELLRERWVA